jgi:hypothetical protein
MCECGNALVDLQLILVAQTKPASRRIVPEREIVLDESISVSELAAVLKASLATVVGIAFKKVGIMITIYETLTFEQASAIARELGFTVRRRGGQTEH